MAFGYRQLALATVFATGLAGAAAHAQENAITIVLPEQVNNLEPCQASRSNVGRVIKQNINEALTRILPADGSVEPLLATGWEQVDEKTWRFTLQEGVKFHDGADFNAEAVAFSIDRLMSGDITCDDRSKFGDVTLTPTVIDEHTIEIATDEPVPILPTLMGMVMIVSPNTPADQIVNDPVGTGPYTVSEFTTETVVLDRFDGYWGEMPEVAKATYVWRTESALRAAMVETGEADLTPAIAIQDATNPETDFAYLNSETTRMRIDAQIPPLDDVRVRKALNLSIDWEGLAMLFGPDVIRASQMVVPGILGHNPDIEPWPYDPEQAVALLEEARADGVPVDATINVIARTAFFPNGQESVEAMMAMWEAVGFNLELTTLDVAGWVRYLDKPFPQDRGPNIFQQQHDNNSGDAVFTAYVMYASDGQYSTVDNPELDQLLDRATSATGQERAEAFQEVFRVVHDEVIADVPMFHMIGYTRVGPRLEWRPTIATNSQIPLADIGFRD
ncbi:ABC transporter substrate-binding protein [Inquilinus sp. CAU 1745]|uniref:ABC transporter substrate-binding protein n=1 Tax=Inquilinus sp. CAU 1745 TaxID=3140369 RepID=UPI00325B6530